MQTAFGAELVVFACVEFFQELNVVESRKKPSGLYFPALQDTPVRIRIILNNRIH